MPVVRKIRMISTLSFVAAPIPDMKGAILAQEHTAALTCADGACALHALWGEPRRNGGPLFCGSVREKVIHERVCVLLVVRVCAVPCLISEINQVYVVLRLA